MSSPKVYIEEKLAERAELVTRIQMMKDHLAGGEHPLGSWEDSNDVTERDVAELEQRVIDIDREIERVKAGNAERPS